MTAVFSQRDQQQILSDLQQWYAPATTASRSGKGRKQREQRSSRAERCGNAFFEVMESSNPPATQGEAVTKVIAELYPLMWWILKPIVMAWVREIVEWLWKRTR
jgi:hypothetical protein